MKYVFLVVAAVWALQFLMASWQLQRFNRQIAALRKRGRCAVGLVGNRWRGRTYGVLVIDRSNTIIHAAVFSGWTVFSTLKAVVGLDGKPLDALMYQPEPLGTISRVSWQALQNAASFFNAAPTIAKDSNRQTTSS